MLNVETGLMAGESMSGGNTISNNALAMSAPGSTPVNPDPTKPSKVDDPGMSESDTASVSDKERTATKHGTTAVDGSWKKV